MYNHKHILKVGNTREWMKYYINKYIYRYKFKTKCKKSGLCILHMWYRRNLDFFFLVISFLFINDWFKYGGFIAFLLLLYLYYLSI